MNDKGNEGTGGSGGSTMEAVGGTSLGGALTGRGAQNTTCAITLSKSEVSQAKPTVGLVHFTTDMAETTSASVEFGLDTNYGMKAPAQFGQMTYASWLVGMKPNRTYHYRVVVSGPEGDCVGPDRMIESGPLPSGVPRPRVDVGAGSAGGFIIVAVGNHSLILDKDGDVVWAHDFTDQVRHSFIGVTSTKLSWDAKYIYARDLGPFDAARGGVIMRIAINGWGGVEVLPTSGGNHHDFTVIPGGIAYLTKEKKGECDHIYTAKANGTDASSLVNTGVAFERYPKTGVSAELCHVNAINYLPSQDVFTVADREKDAIAVFDSSGKLTMAIGQEPSRDLSVPPIIAEGATTTWRVQHGHHLYAPDKLVVFSNHAMGAATSPVLHYTITGNQATLDWSYDDHPATGTQGDVDYLPNGNFLITSSLGGELREIDGATRTMVSRYDFTSNVGYTSHRASLYGPPQH